MSGATLAGNVLGCDDVGFIRLSKPYLVRKTSLPPTLVTANKRCFCVLYVSARANVTLCFPLLQPEAYSLVCSMSINILIWYGTTKSSVMTIWARIHKFTSTVQTHFMIKWCPENLMRFHRRACKKKLVKKTSFSRNFFFCYSNVMVLVAAEAEAA